MATAIVILASGFEEVEALTVVDVLRRAGVECTTAGLGGTRITGAHDITVEADKELSQVSRIPDAVILPGGMPGSEHLGLSAEAKALTLRAHAAGKICAAICAAPAKTLGAWGLLDGRQATCFPGVIEELPKAATYIEENVVEDGNIITSRGIGTAMAFALALVSRLTGRENAETQRKRMLVD